MLTFRLWLCEHGDTERLAPAWTSEADALDALALARALRHDLDLPHGTYGRVREHVRHVYGETWLTALTRLWFTFWQASH